jgi:CubicO group peptidase (beta-lactamase class C family)
MALKRKTILKTSLLFAIMAGALVLLNSNGNKIISKPLITPIKKSNNDSITLLLKQLNADDKAKKLAAFFSKKVETEKFNGCILVAQQGLPIYKASFGYANIEKKIPLDINSEFQLASTSKTFTAIAILQLYEQGKLSLDDDLEKYFKGFPYKGITIKMLLNHRSGLSNYVYDCEPYCEKPNLYQGKKFDNQAMLQILLTHKPIRHTAPNKKFEYCNTNYALLALIIEQVSGSSYASFLEQNIFDSIGMTHSYILSNNQTLSNKRTFGHFANCHTYNDCFADDVVGDKGIYASVEDMLKYDQALYNQKLVKNSTLQLAFTGYSNEHKGLRNYGLGWRIIDDKKSKIVYHNGWWHGYNSTFYRLIDENITVIVLSNKDNRSAYNVSEVFSIMKGKFVSKTEVTSAE